MIPQGASHGGLEAVAIGGEHFVKCIGSGENNLGNEPGVLFDQLRGQDVFELVGELTEFAKTTGGGIAFERVYRAADAAKVFLIGGMLFEREAGFIHGLENLRGTLEEEVAKFGRAIVGQEIHFVPSTF